MRFASMPEGRMPEVESATYLVVNIAKQSFKIDDLP